MALLSSLAAALSKKATVTAGAAVLMVGGGVAIAQSGSVGQNPPGHDVAIGAIIAANDDIANFEALCAEGSRWERSAFCRGDSYHPPGLADRDGDELQDSDELAEGEIVEIDVQPEDNGAEEGDDAQEFSEWVRSLPGEWGCIRGALVSQAAQAGPTGFERANAPIDPETGDVTIEGAAEAAGFDLENLPRCAEVAIARSHGDQPGPPEHAGRPDHAGPPADNGNGNNGNNGNGANGGNGDGNGSDVETSSERRGNGGPPDHVTNRGNGDGPGNSGNAPGRGNSGR